MQQNIRNLEENSHNENSLNRNSIDKNPLFETDDLNVVPRELIGNQIPNKMNLLNNHIRRNVVESNVEKSVGDNEQAGKQEVVENNGIMDFKVCCLFIF